MIKNKRQQQIMSYLSDNGIVSVNELSERFDCSHMTIRRDLDYLEDNGFLRKVHGGAVPIKLEEGLPAFKDRLDDKFLEKKAIGKAALAFIKSGSVICMDAGTSTMSILQHLEEDTQLTVISTGIATSAELCRFRDIDIIQVGGQVHHPSLTVCNLLATEFVEGLNADVAFISTRAFKPEKGTFETNMSLVGEKKALASISRKVVVLADHTKFSGTSFLQALTLNEIDVVITDDLTPKPVINELESAGIEVVVASPE